MFPSKSYRPTWLEVSLPTLDANVSKLIAQLGPGVSLMPCIKADAYAMGAVRVAQYLMQKQVRFFGVATLDEAIELREHGILGEILVLGPVNQDGFDPWIRYHLTIPIIDKRGLESLDYLPKPLKERPKVHICVDTGMGRLGLTPEDTVTVALHLSQNPYVALDGVYTHLAFAADPVYTKVQWEQFQRLLHTLQAHAIPIPHYHIANSAGTATYPEMSRAPMTLVRPGCSLVYTDPVKSPTSQDICSLKSQIVRIQPKKRGDTISYSASYMVQDEVEYIATVPIGYADGLPLAYQQKGTISIRGNSYKVAGQVTMDYTMIRLGSNPHHVQVGDTVTFFGGEADGVYDTAQAMDMLALDFLCSLGKRIPRVYVEQT